jgi:hypothetical protein
MGAVTGADERTVDGGLRSGRAPSGCAPSGCAPSGCAPSGCATARPTARCATSPAGRRWRAGNADAVLGAGCPLPGPCCRLVPGRPVRYSVLGCSPDDRCGGLRPAAVCRGPAAGVMRVTAAHGIGQCGCRRWQRPRSVARPYVRRGAGCAEWAGAARASCARQGAGADASRAARARLAVGGGWGCGGARIGRPIPADPRRTCGQACACHRTVQRGAPAEARGRAHFGRAGALSATRANPHLPVAGPPP